MADGRRPTISIGMPTFNGERFIERAIDSVLAQTFGDFELIISDNASTDRTADICARYARSDPRVRYIRQSENGGASLNFTYVLAQARAPYFCWVADDDERNPEFFARLLARMEPDVPLAVGALEFINAENDLVLRHPPFKYDSGALARSVRYFLAPENSGKACLIYGLFRTDVVRSIRIHPYFRCLYGNDMHINFDVLQRGRVVTEPGAVFRFRVYPIETHRSTGWVRDDSGQPLARRVWRRIDQVLLLRGLHYIAVYPLIARGTTVRLMLILLAPLKYVMMLSENVKLAIASLKRKFANG